MADHFHPRQLERFEVLEGTLKVRLAGELRTVSKGDAFEVPPGTRHAMWNDSAGEARLRWHTEPALRTLDLFRKLAALAAEGRTDGRGTPGLLQAAVLASHYRDELRLTHPPRPVQQVAFAVLAPLGRLLGYRAT